MTEALRHFPADQDVQIEACGAVANLANNSKNNRVKLGRSVPTDERRLLLCRGGWIGGPASANKLRHFGIGVLGAWGGIDGGGNVSANTNAEAF